jgi:hypothetical protein
MLLLLPEALDVDAAGPARVIAYVYTWGVLWNLADPPSPLPSPRPGRHLRQTALWAYAAETAARVGRMEPPLPEREHWTVTLVVELLERAALDPRCVTVYDVALVFLTALMSHRRRVAALGHLVDPDLHRRVMRVVAQLLIDRIDAGAPYELLEGGAPVGLGVFEYFSGVGGSE